MGGGAAASPMLYEDTSFVVNDDDSARHPASGLGGAVAQRLRLDLRLVFVGAGTELDSRLTIRVTKRRTP